MPFFIGRSVFALILCICLPCSADSPLPEAPFAVLLDGRAVAARLQGITDQGDWVFDQSGQTTIVPRNELVYWGTCHDRCDSTWVFLDNGSVLVADLLRIGEDAVVVNGGIWPETRLPRPLVRAILFRPPLNSMSRDKLIHRILLEPREEDRLLLDQGDELRGTVPDEVAPEPGAFHPEKIAWPVKGALEPIDVSFKRITAILFAASDGVTVAADAPRQWIGLRDGSRLLAQRVIQAEDSLEFDLSGGTTLITEIASGAGANPCNRIVFLQPLGTEVEYLSDMQPAGYKHIPFFSSIWPYRNDRSVSGGHLRTRDGLALKGIGMHSSSRLAYRLPEGDRELHGELSIDERAGQSGSVIFRVYAESSAGNWNKAFESDIVRGGQRPIPMRVDLEDASRMALIVDFADRADQWDHANWLNLRLVP